MTHVTQAVVLVGGRGTRLGSLTDQTPKPMVDVSGRPFLEYVLDTLAAQGFTDIVLLTGYLSDAISTRYHGIAHKGARITCVREATPLGTAGALQNAADILHEQFIMLNGDTFFDINLRALCQIGNSYDGPSTLALRTVEGDRYGAVMWDGRKIHSFAMRGVGGVINGGIYFLRKSILQHIPSRLPASIEGDVFPVLAELGVLYGAHFEDFFIDIGIPEALAQAQETVPAQMLRPTLFFDRDGVLNLDTGYVHAPEEFIWRDGVIEAIRALNDARWRICVVTNQAGVARGYYSEEAVQKLHRWMNAELAKHGAYIDAFYYSPYHPTEATVERYRQASGCRKPAPGMLLQAMRDWPISPHRSLLIGDKDTDIQAATAANISGILLSPSDDLAKIVADIISTHVEG